MMNKLYPCLWFDGNAKEAADYYCAVFKNSRITADTPMVVNFEINGQKFMGLNGGPMFHFNEAVSYVVECADQEEIDYYWNSLTSDGGEESRCGWLKDKFGLSWQIVPGELGKLMSKGDPVKGNAMMQALMKMGKLDIAALKAAYEAG
ncbi:MAG: VOC family protein [Chitinophagaceae bacterium]|nr:MAG: VOC family protein [Chitinophagaceae bacterium]